MNLPVCAWLACAAWLFGGAGAWAQTVPSSNAPPRPTPCDDAFTYLKVVMDAPSAHLDSQQFELLLVKTGAMSCVDHLEQVRKLPSELEASLEVLVNRTVGAPSSQEEAAATALCLLAPTFRAPTIGRIAEHPVGLPSGVADLCRAAAGKLPVIEAVRAGGDVSATLVRTTLLQDPDAPAIPYWAPPWLAQRRDIARSGSSLLLAAHQQRADGFDGLRRALCTTPETELTDACRQTSGSGEQDWKRARGHQSLLLNYGLATAIIGGLATVAYLNRGGDLGRAVAIGSGIVGGAALGVTLTFAASRGGGDTRGMGTLLLAVPMAALGGIGGGIAASKLSEEPGAPRFATAAVPLSAAWLAGAAMVIHGW